MAGGFTGTFWGVCCQDLATRSAWADFAFFDYRPI
jgi:beta-xylosidase